MHGLYGKHNQCNDCRSINRKNINVERIEEGTKVCHGSECLKENDNGVEKDVSEFHSDKNSIQDGLHSLCKKCRKVRNATYMSNMKNYIKLMLKNAKYNAKRKTKDISVKITVQDIINLYDKQNGLCALTGIEMKHEIKITIDKKQHIVNRFNMSIDRIDPSKGYVIDNIQLICSIINIMKYILSNDEFIEICKLIHKYNNKKTKKPIKMTSTKKIKQYITLKYCDMHSNAKKDLRMY